MVLGDGAVGQTAKTDRDARISYNEKLEVLKELVAEEEALKRNQAAIDGSQTLRIEEAASLRKHFPGVAVDPSFTTYQFIAAVRAEQAAQRRRMGDDVLIVKQAAGQRACDAIKAMRQKFATRKADGTWTSMTLDQRSSLQARMEEIEAQVRKEDPCGPITRDMIDDTQIAVEP